MRFSLNVGEFDTLTHGRRQGCALGQVLLSGRRGAAIGSAVRLVVGVLFLAGLAACGPNSGGAAARAAAETVSVPLTSAPAEASAGAPLVPSDSQVSAFDAFRWSGNPSDRFKPAADIEEVARRVPALAEQRAWEAVVAWQSRSVAEGRPPNEALYMAVGIVLEFINRNDGVCVPGRADLIPAFLSGGVRMTLLNCTK